MARRENNNELHKNPKMKAVAASYFNRSMTVYHGHATADAFGISRKPSVERMGSIKKLSEPSAFESMGNSFAGKVRKLFSLFDSQTLSRSFSNLIHPQSKPSILSSSAPAGGSEAPFLPGMEDRVVIYFTSLRGIRRTFEDCNAARMILKSYRINVDERDISMHNAYRVELESVTGQMKINLPQIFIKGKHIGGAEVIRQLNEVGELSKMLRGLPTKPPGYVCKGCGDVRFIPCANCDGSRKLYDEDDDQVRRCPVCNENGLVRCPFCCD